MSFRKILYHLKYLLCNAKYHLTLHAISTWEYNFLGTLEDDSYAFLFLIRKSNHSVYIFSLTFWCSLIGDYKFSYKKKPISKGLHLSFINDSSFCFIYIYICIFYYIQIYNKKMNNEHTHEHWIQSLEGTSQVQLIWSYT